MAVEQGAGNHAEERGFFRWAVPLLWLIILLSLAFAALIFVIPLDAYRLIGHLFEAVAALFCMACCLYLHRTVADRLLLLLAAFAFFSYALSTMFWYLYTVALGRLFVFTTVAEFGFLCFFFFFIAAISIEFPDRGMKLSSSALLLLLFLSIPLAAGVVTGDNQPVHLALIMIRFLVIGLLVVTAIRHGIHTYTLLWAGLCLRCLASMLYGVRETIFTIYPVPLFPGTSFTPALNVYDFLSMVGPMIICSFALIQIGLFSYIINSRNASGNVM
jgi:hypothetical protein